MTLLQKESCQREVKLLLGVLCKGEIIVQLAVFSILQDT